MPPIPTSSVSGQVRADADGVIIYVGFWVEVGSAGVSGIVHYTNSSQEFFAGRVSCYHREGNEAGFSGSIEYSNLPGILPGPAFFFVEVIDRTATGEPNAIRVRADNTPYDCSELSRGYPGTVLEGVLRL